MVVVLWQLRGRLEGQVCRADRAVPVKVSVSVSVRVGSCILLAVWCVSSERLDMEDQLFYISCLAIVVWAGCLHVLILAILFGHLRLQLGWRLSEW